MFFKNAIAFIIINLYSEEYYGLFAVQVIVRKWDQQEERLVKVSEEEVFIYLNFLNHICYMSKM
jgi:predicted KAP-like P-loop ATPase